MTSKSFISVLASMATEFDKLAGLAGEIDLAIGQLVVSRPGLESNARAALQQIDLLRQSLECITEYLKKLTEQVDANLQINPAAAAKGLTLNDLARSLACSGAQEARNKDQEISFF